MKRQKGSFEILSGVGRSLPAPLWFRLWMCVCVYLMVACTEKGNYRISIFLIFWENVGKFYYFTSCYINYHFYVIDCSFTIVFRHFQGFSFHTFLTIYILIWLIINILELSQNQHYLVTLWYFQNIVVLWHQQWPSSHIPICQFEFSK